MMICNLHEDGKVVIGYIKQRLGITAVTDVMNLDIFDCFFLKKTQTKTNKQTSLLCFVTSCVTASFTVF